MAYTQCIVLGLDGTPTSPCSCVRCCSREHRVTTYRSTRQGCPNCRVVTCKALTSPAYNEARIACYCFMYGGLTTADLLCRCTPVKNIFGLKTFKAVSILGTFIVYASRFRCKPYALPPPSPFLNTQNRCKGEGIHEIKGKNMHSFSLQNF